MSGSGARAAPTLLALLALAGGVLIVYAVYWPGDDEAPMPASGGREGPLPVAPAAGPDGVAEHPVGDTGTRATQQPDRTILVSCRERASGRALAGVRLYEGVEPVAGPSDAAGALEVRAPPAGSATLWVEGWLPVAVQGAALPAEALFDSANATVEVRFENATSEHRLLRSVLQPHAPSSTPEGPWTPSFRERALDVWIAERVPPGRYDLYLWVTFPDGEPRPFSRRAFVVAAGESTRLSIDLAAPRDPDELESDS